MECPIHIICIYTTVIVSGSSNNTCCNDYRGVAPQSELESQHMKTKFLSIDPQPSLAVGVHSFAEKLLTPYGYKFPMPDLPDNIEEIVIIKAL